MAKAKTVWFKGYIEVEVGSAEWERLTEIDGLTPDAGPPEAFDEIPLGTGGLGNVGEGEAEDATGYSKLKKAELIELCQSPEREIEVESSDTVKTLIAKLERHDAQAGTGEDPIELT